MQNLLIKDLVKFSNARLFCASTEWSLEKVVSYLVDNSIPACPVTSSNLNKGQIRQIDGYAILSEISLLLKDRGDEKIKGYLNMTSRTLSDDQYLVDFISVLHRKPIFSVKDKANIFYANIYPKDISEFFHGVSSQFLHLRSIENHIATFIEKYVSHLTVDEESVQIEKAAFGDKINALFDDIWDQTNINYDRTMMRNRLNKCIDLRNQYFHHRSENIDNVFLKESWSIIKRVIK